ncbi:PP2C family protein-serine/threonine phosphatase [Ilumatobacter coccineus]|uniref:Putative serine/threonine protein phosphatase n=1 Tax=Ilumatobacter coccineus (strain NBRC 103263 / KCTC 29153 / YM16-304) TaxID=1313172 RepID=A0A6C7EAI0_ILUCY|nr:SpoIIE family protein phosphatase [Ilumatobacter coccineus]BAN02135.1 putative serine/threonine protein phosphatase [Ilumatobacter coccineus YM16-304]
MQTDAHPVLRARRIEAPVVFLIVYALYVIGGSLAWWTINASGLSAVFFPPAGMTVVAFLALPRRDWPVVVAAVVAGEITTGLTVGRFDNMASLLGFSAANFIGPLVGAIVAGRLLHRSPGSRTLPDLGRRRDLIVFTIAAVAIGPFVSSVIGALTAWWQFGSPVTSVGPQWWLGDALGVAVVAPALLAWNATTGPRPWRGPAALILLASVWIGTAITLFATDLPLMFLVLGALIVAGASFDVRTVAVIGIAIAIIVGISLSTDPDGLVVGLAPSTALTTLKLQFLVFAMTAYFVAAETNEAAIATADVKRRLETVEDLQGLLLPPRTMAGQGFRVRGVYDAAIQDVGVGGDWYVVRPTQDGRLVFGVGDIVGHDLKSARAMVAVRSGLILEAAINPEPARLLSKLDGFSQIEPSIRFSTAWIGVFDPDARTLEYACAGHPPPVLVLPDGYRRLDGANSALIGLPQGERCTATVEVPFGSALAMYSDGLVETRDETIDHGLDRFEQAISTHGLEPEGLIEAMLSGRRRDDDTILAVIDLDYAPVGDWDEGDISGDSQSDVEGPWKRTFRGRERRPTPAK